jgi:O-methyltransferase
VLKGAENKPADQLFMNLPDSYLSLVKRLLTDTFREDFAETRHEGLDWPENGFTMIGLKRLENLQQCVESALRDQVPGDLVETGVWKGGSTILMRALLLAHHDATRRVWVADSFAGLPPPNVEKYPSDAGDTHYQHNDSLAISLAQVQANFARFGLLDERVKFLPGWFSETLPTAPIEQIAVLRLDGDMYESTMDGLVNLYPKLSVGGYAIIDDYGYIASCRQAVDDYRRLCGIQDPIIPVDWTGVYWRRT